MFDWLEIVVQIITCVTHNKGFTSFECYYANLMFLCDNSACHIYLAPTIRYLLHAGKRFTAQES